MAVLPERTVTELWGHARELAALAVQELEPAHARRALVTLAVAGSGTDARDYTTVVAEVHHAFVKLALDPVPLFDAASALCARDDEPAREALVTFPRRAPADRKLSAFGLDE